MMRTLWGIPARVLVIPVGLLVGFGVGLLVMPSPEPPADPAPMTDPMSQDVDTMMLSIDHNCTSDGFADGTIPGGALVWRDGATVHTSFDEGWSVYESGQGGVLLAVCES